MAKIKVSSLVVCSGSISENEGGPRIGEVYEVKSISKSGIHIGFSLPRLHPSYAYDIASGTEPNWDIRNFKLISNTRIAKLLYRS